LLLPGATARHLVAAPFAVAAAPVLPAGFADTKLATIPSPTGLAATPDGRLLIATQPGLLRIYKDNALLPGPALDLRTRICTQEERGLSGVAVDPSFQSNRFIYVYYTFPKFGTCDQNTPNSPVNRVSRFTLSDTNSVDLATELVLVDGIPSPGGQHGGGDVQFGKDGYLYVSVGDGACDYAGDSGCFAQNDAARDQHVLLGKILRVTSSGGIPPTNPFVGADSARCSPAGKTTAGKKCQETFAWGRRNPFRMGFDPNAATTRFFINDVGERTWEEIDLGQAGADYGWNVREGPCALGSTTNCGPPAAGMTNPIFAYPSTTGCRSVTGAAFVPNGLWPAEYDGAYLYGDFVCGKIFKLTQSGGTYTSTEFASGLGDGGSVISMMFGPSGTGRALYYTNYAGGGELHRIAFIAAGSNRPPFAAATASPTSGPVPLTVNFDASASSDPDTGDTLTYVWYFGDRSSHVLTQSPTVSYTYSAKGTFFAELYVQDEKGARSPPLTIRVDPGNDAPAPTILFPTGNTRYAVGQTIILEGSATDPEDGPLPDSALTWEVILVHDDHTHPFLQPTAGNRVSIVTPPPEDFLATTNSYLVVTLTATDSRGLAASTTRQLLPRLVSVTLGSDPAGVSFDVNAFPVTTPRTITSWEAYELNVTAPAEVTQAGTTYRFARWTDGSTASSRKIVTPASAASYTAVYEAAGGASETQTFSIVGSGEDGHVEKGATTYPPPPNAATSVGTVSTNLLVRRSKTASAYTPVSVALIRFDTSALPDGATVTAATLELHAKSRTSSDGRSLVGEWYPASSWPIDAADWTNTDSATAFTATPLSSIAVGATNSFELRGLGSVSRTGSTALRLHVTGHGQAPTGGNDVGFASLDDPTLPEPRLVVTYSTR